MRYDFLPCLACGSMDHFLDDCPDGEVIAAYYNTDEPDELESPVERWNEDRQDPGE